MFEQKVNMCNKLYGFDTAKSSKRLFHRLFERNCNKTIGFPRSGPAEAPRASHGLLWDSVNAFVSAAVTAFARAFANAFVNAFSPTALLVEVLMD